MIVGGRVDVAIVGAFGAVGREFSAQILSSKLLDSTCRLQLVGHRGHGSEREMYGLPGIFKYLLASNIENIDGKVLIYLL